MDIDLVVVYFFEGAYFWNFTVIEKTKQNRKCVVDFPSCPARAFFFPLPSLVSSRYKVSVYRREPPSYHLSSCLLSCLLSLSQAYFADGDKVSSA